MATRQQKLLQAKQKLDKFQKKRLNSNYSIQAALSQSSVNAGTNYASQTGSAYDESVVSVEQDSPINQQSNSPVDLINTMNRLDLNEQKTPKLERKLSTTSNRSLHNGKQDDSEYIKALNDKIKSLELNISKLNEEKNDASVEGLQRECVHLAKQLERATSEHQEQMNIKDHEISSFQKEVSELKVQLQEYQKSISALKVAAKEAETTISELNEAKELLSVQNQSSDQIQDLMDKINSHVELEKELRAQIDDLTQKFDKVYESDCQKTQEIAHLSNLLKEKNDALAEMEKRLIDIENQTATEISTLLEKVKEFELQLQSANVSDQVEFYRHEYDSIKETADRLSNELQVLEQENSDLYDEKSRLNIEIDSRETRIENMKQELELVNNQQSKLLLNIRSVFNQVVETYHKYDDPAILSLDGLHTDVVLQFDRLSDLLQRLIQMFEERLHLKDVEDLDLRQTIIDLTTERDALLSQRPSDGTLLDQLQQITLEQAQEIEKLKRDGERMQQQDDLKYAELSIENDQLKLQLEELHSPDSQLERLKQELSNQKQFYESESVHLKEKIALLENTENDHQSILLEELQMMNEIQAQEIQILKEQVAQGESASDENSGVPDSTAQHIQELQSINEERLQEIEGLHEALKEKTSLLFQETQDFNMSLASREELIRSQAEEIENLKQELASTPVNGQSEHGLVEELQFQVEDQMIEIESLKADLETKSKLILHQTEEISLLKNNSAADDADLLIELDAVKAQLQSTVEENENLSKQVQIFVNDMNTITELSQSYVQEISDLKEQLATNGGNNDDLLIQNEELNIELTMVHEQVQQLTNEVDSLKLELSQVRESSAAAIKKLDSSVEENSILVETLRDLTDQNSALKKDIQNLQKEIMEKDAQSHQNLIQITELENVVLKSNNTEKIEQLEIQLYETRLQYQDLILETQNQTDRLHALNDQLTFQSKELDHSRERANSLLMELEESEKHISELEGVIQKNESTFSAMQLEFEKERDTLKFEIAQLTTSLNNNVSLNKNARSGMESELLALKSELEESETRVQQLEKIITENNEGFQTELHSYELKLNELRLQATNSASLKDDLMESEERIQQLERIITQNNDNFQSELLKYEQRIEQLKSKNSDSTILLLREDLEESEERVKQLERIITENNENFQKELHNYELQLESLKASVSDQSEILQVKQELLESEEHISQLEAIITDNNSKYQALLDEFQMEREQLEYDLSNVKEQLHNAQREAELHATQQRYEDAETRVSHLEQEIYQLQQGYSMNGEQSHKLSESIRELEKELDESRQDCAEAEERIQLLESIIESNNQEFSKLLEAENAHKAEIEKELDNMRQECEENERRITQLETVIDSNNTHFEVLLRDKEVIYCDLESKTIILEARNEILEKEFLDLLSVHRSAQIDKSSVDSELYESKIEIMQLNAHLTETSQYYEGLLAEKKSEIEDLLSKLSQLEQHTESLSQTIHGSQELYAKHQELLSGCEQHTLELNELRETVSRLQSDIAELSEEKNSLKSKVQVLEGEIDGKTNAVDLNSELSQAKMDLEKVNADLLAAQENCAQWEQYCNNTLAETQVYYQTQIDSITQASKEETVSLLQRLEGANNEIELLKTEISEKDINLQILLEDRNNYSEKVGEYEAKLLELQSNSDSLGQNGVDQSLYEQLQKDNEVIYAEIELIYKKFFPYAHYTLQNCYEAIELLHQIEETIQFKESELNKVAEIQKGYESAKHDALSKEHFITQLNSELEDVKRDLEEKNYEFADMTTKIQNLEIELAEKENQIEDLSISLDEFNRNTARYTEQIDSLRNELDLQAAAYAELQTEAQYTMHKTEEIERLNAQITEMYAKEAELQSQIKEVSQKNVEQASLKQRLAEFEQQVSDLQSKLDQNRQYYENQIQDLEAKALENEVKIDENLLKELYGQIGMLNQEKTTLQLTNETSANELQNLHDTLNSLNETISTMTTQHEENSLILQDWQAYAQSLEAEKTELSSQNAQLAQQLQSMQDQLEQIYNTVVEAEKERDSAQQQLAEIKISKVSIEEKLNATSIKLKSLQESQDKSFEDTLRFESEINSLKKDIGKYKEELKNQKDLEFKLNEELNHTLVECNSLKEQSTEFKKLKSKVELIENEKVQLQNDLDQSYAMVENLEMKLDQTQQSQNRLHMTSSHELNERDSQLSTLHNEKTRLEQRVHELESQLYNQSQENYNGQMQIGYQFETLQKNLDKVSATANALQESENRLRRELDEAIDISNSKDREMEDLRTSLAELKKAHGESAYQPRSASASPKDLQDRLKELQAANQQIYSLELEISRLSSLVENAGSHYDVEQLLASINEWKQKYEEAEQKYEELAVHSSGKTGRYLSNSDYNSLVSKAAQVDQYVIQVRQLLNVTNTFEKDIESLQRAIQASIDNKHLPQERLEAELQTSLLHESKALQAIRKSFAEAQEELLRVKEDAQIQIQQSREEFDELAHLFENVSLELEQVKQSKSSILARGGSSQSAGLESHHKLTLMISTLEAEKVHLLGEIQKLNVELETVRMKSVDSKNAKEIQAKLDTRIIVLEDEIRELQRHIRDTEAKLKQAVLDGQRAQQNYLQLTEQMNSGGRDKDVVIRLEAEIASKNNELMRLDHMLMEERMRSRELEDEIHNVVMNEQRQARDHLNFKLNELRLQFDRTLDEMAQKNAHLERLLEDSERTIVEDRAIYIQRENALVHDIRSLQSQQGNNRWSSRDSQASNKQFELDQEIRKLDARIYELAGENRKLKKTVESLGNQHAKERYALLGDISTLKHELEDSKRIIKSLQEQKTNIEFALSQKEERLKILEDEVKGRRGPQDINDEILSLNKQKEALEKILLTRESELQNAELRIGELLNAQNNSFRSPNIKERNGLVNDFKSPIDAEEKGIDLLRSELADLYSVANDIFTLISQLFSHLLEIPMVDLKKQPPNILSSYISKFKSHCNHLIQEVLYLRGINSKLILWRNDLQYQKLYMNLQLEDMEHSNETCLRIMKGHGIPVPDQIKKASPKQKWRRAYYCIIALARMKKMSLQWQFIEEEGKRLMVCTKCEKKLTSIVTPETWKEGSKNTVTGSAGRKLNENKLLSKISKTKFTPYETNKCKICKKSVAQRAAHYCQHCAYKKGICAMCGVMILDIRESGNVWSEHVHEGLTYYYNSATKESVWERPKDYLPPPKPKLAPPNLQNIPEKRNFEGEERLVLAVLKSELIANGAIVLVNEQGVTIGRDKSFEERLRLNELAVSRFHCSIYFQREFKIVDNGSTHGTFLNNIKLSHSKQSSVPFTLNDGDFLEIGSTKFQVHLHELCEKCDPQVQSVVSTAPTAKKKTKVVESVPYVPKVNLEQQRLEELERLKQKYLPNDTERVSMSFRKDRLPIRELPEPVEVKAQSYIKPLVLGKKQEAPIDATNKGNLMLQRMGWKEGQGLGKEKEGIVDPVKMSSQKGRRGLGA
ncbi:hypothetical protein HDV06_001014 [Boothiomyces sp. JEL0866]|nr:hypothetical protein HDV06_001014 [Boothiomyces sp. JEL0866]